MTSLSAIGRDRRKTIGAETLAPKKRDHVAERRTNEKRKKSSKLIRRIGGEETSALEFESSRLVNGRLEYMLLVQVLLDTRLRSHLWSRLSPEHFFTDSSRAIFMRMTALMRAGKDVPTLAVLAADPVLPEASRILLASALSRIEAGKSPTRAKITLPGGKSVRLYSRGDYEQLVFKLLDDLRIVRQGAELMFGGVERLSKSNDPDASANNLADIGGKLMSLRRADQEENKTLVIGHKSTKLDDKRRRARLRKMINDDSERYLTGFDSYDTLSGGLHPGEVTVIGTMPGGGKTALMLSMMVNMFRLGTSTAMLQLELGERQVDQRLSSMLAEVNGSVIRRGELRTNGKARRKIQKAWTELHSLGEANNTQMLIDSPTSQTVEGCELMFKRYPYKVWFIDYINLIDMPGREGEDWQKLRDVVKAFRKLAKKYQIAIVMAAQISVDEETGKLELRYSKAIRDETDNLIGWNLTDDAKEAGCVYLQHMKARQYEAKDFQLGVQLQYSRFTNWSEEEQIRVGSREVRLGGKRTRSDKKTGAVERLDEKARRPTSKSGKSKKPAKKRPDEMDKVVNAMRKNDDDFDAQYADA